MPRICFIFVAGLNGKLLNQTENLPTLSQFTRKMAIKPVLPAVTSVMQATVTTGKPPGEHGIIANGLYTHNRTELLSSLDLSSFSEARRAVSFWEQANNLLDCPRFWRGSATKVAMLFWQQSIGASADVVLTPKPEHSPDGKTFTACYSSPAGLYPKLLAELGPFPLQHYWGPMANFTSTKWIMQAAQKIWKDYPTDLQLLYVPHLDYNLQRLGPDAPAVQEDLRMVDSALAQLMGMVCADGGIPVVAGDYGMNAVDTAIAPNLALRRAGLLITRPDAAGKLLVNYDESAAFAMVDHQIAHVYCNSGRDAGAARLLAALPGVDRALTEPSEFDAAGLNHGRSGDIILLAKPNAWFMHDWWETDAEKPAWQFGVDIHNKPGYDPRELFFDPIKKCVAQDPALVRGSHGVFSADVQAYPVLLTDAQHAPPGDVVEAQALAPWLARLL